MPVQPLDIFCYYDKQRFEQFGSMDCANWYGIGVPTGKRGQALYPAMGRKHISYFGQNRLIFNGQPRQLFKTINYAYVIVGTTVIQIDRFFNEKIIGNIPLGSQVWFDYLPVGNKVYAILTAQTKMYVIIEDVVNVTMVEVTDPNAPTRPKFVASFGNRFVVSQEDTPDYYLSTINLDGDSFDPNTCFTILGAPLFNRASGIVRQFAVLHNQLYIFCDFTTDIWANIATQIVVANVVREFPWKKNTSYNFDYGMADPFSLSVGFGRMTWLAKNSDGLVSFMTSEGQRPVDISSQAINVLLENSIKDEGLSPFLSGTTSGFLYQYDNTIFYRVVAGEYLDYGELDIADSAHALEFNFDTQKWARVIELNGERNRIQRHVFFNNMHLVTVSGDTALYQMAGNIYHNELRRKNTAPQDKNAFRKFPMRYTLVTQQIFMEDYAEFITDYVEIDFVFGHKTFYESEAPFDNTIFIVHEDSVPDCPIYIIKEEAHTDGDPIFVIKEEGNTPGFDDNHYNALFKPHVELFASDDGGVTYFGSLDLLKFSPLGNYRWRMRWYNCGPSRNRTYKLDCVSSAPIVVLGAVHSIRRASGGAN